MSKREWHRLNDDFSAIYYPNGRTDVRRRSTDDTVVTYSQSLQDELRLGRLESPLRYLFGTEAV